VPFYSPDDGHFQNRVHQNRRPVNQRFSPDERLYRRFPKKYLINGRPVPLNIQSIQFGDDSGISVNRGSCCEPQDVLEPDCCGGTIRHECVVLEILVSELPEGLTTENGSQTFRFPMRHVPRPLCYAHSEVWCNDTGDIERPYQRPPKEIRDHFRAHIAKCISRRVPLEFNLLQNVD
jgi:hypothetical protein